ncbi:hypothetical protein EV673_1786 [Limnobacter thiooxidans]|uniref:Uncharacterized protein n=1 Tax=Limnobacter thiooxidans TaxID=131080 RepID=A0AA86J1X1_9BURK|nr:hypothetical protein [Limnobacter sp.]MCZ8016137.1 hypothetical protein [Limnobacter sp.]RZS40029.1 hypothetical protein EV673_1786 [Limnobacter thiooxidans]BET27543.1 hypothetical protein RGQ30_30440 [Limnobacter thiooxidans]
MEVLDVGARVFGFADRHAKKVDGLLSQPEFGTTPADIAVMSYEMQMMGSMWQLAASLVKDMTEPLKSIVNK